MFTLRDDQRVAEEEFLGSSAHSVVIQAMTGYGKTVLSSSVTKRWIGLPPVVGRQRRVVFMVHRNNLALQKSQKLSAFGVPHGLRIEGHVSDPDAAVQVCSIQTLAAAPDQMPELDEGDLLIIDECHRKDARKITQHYFAPRVLGFTATPIEDNGMPLRGYQRMIVTLQPSELERIGALMRGTVYAVDLFAADGDDLDPAKVAAYLQRDGVVSRYAETIASWDRAPTVVFCQTIPHARQVRDQLIKLGVRAVAQDSLMDRAERDEAYQQFMRGDADVICNANILIEGWDCPWLRRVVMLRPTESEIIFRQQYGRGTRVFPGKADWELWDFAGNVIRHGDPFSDRKWSLSEEEARAELKKRRSIGVWRCPSCFQACEPARVRDTCPKCGAPAVATSRIGTRAGKLVRWDTAHLARLAEIKASEQAQAAENAKRIKALFGVAYRAKVKDAHGFAMKNFKKWEKSGEPWSAFYAGLQRR